MTRLSAKLAFAAMLVLSLFACNTVRPPNSRVAAPTATASLVLEQTQRLTTQELVPEALTVPVGNVLFRSLIGIGDQIYACRATDAGFAWTFVAPRADLYTFRFSKVVRHFGGPTWRDNADGSAVVGRLLQSVPAPLLLDAQPAIPWLLLEAASTTNATDGTPGAFTPATFVRRLYTVGGVAPTSGCDASTVGQNKEVPYAALYEFYRARN